MIAKKQKFTYVGSGPTGARKLFRAFCEARVQKKLKPIVIKSQRLIRDYLWWRNEEKAMARKLLVVMGLELEKMSLEKLIRLVTTGQGDYRVSSRRWGRLIPYLHSRSGRGKMTIREAIERFNKA